MAGKGESRGAGSAFDNELGKSVADSAQRIWLAGLGAFERARDEGPRVFDALVEQGQQVNDRAREATEQALRTVRESANAAGGTFGRLEQAIEERIARTLSRMGVITRAEVNDLSAQVSQLADEMHRAVRTRTAPRGSAKRGAKPKRRVAPRRGKAARAKKRRR